MAKVKDKYIFCANCGSGWLEKYHRIYCLDCGGVVYYKFEDRKS